ncbi:MAG: Qat anti-phage system ATPase QatA [Phycisphaerales bacterium]
MILHDNETKVDLLNAEPVAATIAQLLMSRPGTPMTIGVHGDWGAGKSSVLEMVEHIFQQKGENSDVLCLKFNGWRFQGFEDAKIALIEGIVEALIEARPFLTTATGAVKDVFRRIDYLKLAKSAGSLAFTTTTGIPAPEILGTVVGAFQRLLDNPDDLLTEENVSKAIETTKSVLKPADSRHIPEEIREFRKAFDKLLGEAKVKQLIILVDDLDRCLPETAIETLEAIRLFVFTSKTAFVIAADEAMIEYAVRQHFPDLPGTTGPRTYSQNYLEKLIQVPFRLPSLGVTETRVYVTLLLIGAVVGDDNPGFVELIGKTREKLRRPWEGKTIADADLSASFTTVPNGVRDAFTLAEQIGPVLAEGTGGNPRQIKRFLNSLLLRLETAKARGFGKDIKAPVLAKLMIAERFLPSVFDELARVTAASGNGIPPELATLETQAAALEKEVNPAPKEKGSAKGLPAATIPESWKSDFAMNWARLLPQLSGENLSPYLFLTRDQRGFFDGLTLLGHLSDLVEKLMGPELAVKGLEGELSKLAPSELEQLFDHLRTRIVGSGELAKLPPGMSGLKVVVRASPALQPRLVDFLEQLPVGALGPWAVSGWDGIITDPTQKMRIARVISRWAVSDNKTLASVAKAAGAIPSLKGRH